MLRVCSASHAVGISSCYNFVESQDVEMTCWLELILSRPRYELFRLGVYLLSEWYEVKVLRHEWL